jgi:predicted DNA-binding transcriptional regulator AlpA
VLSDLSSTNPELDMTTSVAPLEDAAVLTATETAAMLGVSKFTLLRMRQRSAADGLPFVKLSPNRIGYLRSDVQAFLAARRVGVLPEAA